MPRYKGANQPRDIINRLLDGTLIEAMPIRVEEPPPALQVEAADAIRSLRYEVQRHMDFLRHKHLIVEYATYWQNIEISENRKKLGFDP